MCHFQGFICFSGAGLCVCRQEHPFALGESRFGLSVTACYKSISVSWWGVLCFQGEREELIQFVMTDNVSHTTQTSSLCGRLQQFGNTEYKFNLTGLFPHSELSPSDDSSIMLN